MKLGIYCSYGKLKLLQSRDIQKHATSSSPFHNKQAHRERTQGEVIYTAVTASMYVILG